MKNADTTAPPSVRKWLAKVGRKGGKNGSKPKKRKAAIARWAKEKPPTTKKARV